MHVKSPAPMVRGRTLSLEGKGRRRPDTDNPAECSAEAGRPPHLMEAPDMSVTKARQIVLAARPQGKPRVTDFRLEETAVPTPGPGQVLLRVQFLSLDPYMRERMNARESYQSPIALGDV